MLSKKQKKQYLKKDKPICPFCNKLEGYPITVIYNTSMYKKARYQTYRCFECDKTWQEVFILTDVKELPDKKKVDIDKWMKDLEDE